MQSRKGLSELLRACALLGSAVFFVQASLAQEPQLPASATLVKASRLLDPRTGHVLSPAAVLIEDSEIKEVGPPAAVQSHAPAGVRTIAWYYPGKTRGQASVATIINLRDAGMPALDVIRAITVNAAEMLGWQDRIGAIEPGKFADLIAVAGDPVADITELERVRFIMKGGQVIRNELAPH
jgi:imidazolonepropionase-like amidohydrolase